MQRKMPRIRVRRMITVKRDESGYKESSFQTIAVPTPIAGIFQNIPGASK